MLFMMWYDNSKDPLTKKIERAAAYYQNKYAKIVRTVVINPQDAEDSTVPGVAIITSTQCQRHHLLVSEETI